MKKLAWKQILITFAVSFVLGTAFGRWEFSSLMQKKWKDPEARQAWILKRLDSRLDLNASQKEKIAVILKEAAPQWEAIRQETRPRFEAAKQQVREKIRPLLDADQQKKYDQMETEWRERRDHRRGMFR